MSREFYTQAAELTSAGQAFAIATVVRVEGSSSARRGSKAIIDSQGKLLAGWVGGGCAESAVKSEALKCIEIGRPQLITLDMRDEELGVGMPCGGKMEVFVEPVLPKPELLIVGHGRIAETLSAIGHVMGFEIIVNDPGADPVSFPNASRVITEDFDLTETPIGPKTFVVIATQHKRDHLWLERALDGNAAYVALVASRHRAKLVLDYLAAAGVPARKIRSVRAPAGLDLGAATPEEIALSIVSEMVAVRRGGNASSLSLKESDLEKAHPAADRVIRQCEVEE
ncbi:MAG TPA: XdhC family protein [Terriglobales bacterium]